MYSDINNKHTIGQAPNSHPTYNKQIKNMDISSTKSGYQMRDFIMSTKYNFMTGE